MMISPDPDSTVSSFLHVILGVSTPEASQKKVAVPGDKTTTSTGATSITGVAVYEGKTLCTWNPY